MQDDGMAFGILFTVYFIIINVCFWGFSSSDAQIVHGKKIKIDNAVYECKKTQELDLK